MTQGGRTTSSLLRLSSIPPAARPSAERVRAVAASTALEVQLLKKLAQRPLMSGWEGQPKEGKRVALTVVDASSTPVERARVLDSARALMAMKEAPGVQRVHRVSDEAHAFVSDLWTTGTAADLSVLRWQMSRKLDFGRKVCAALVSLHEAGIVHGSLCPENILLDDDFGPVVTEARMVSIAESLEGDRDNFFGYGAFAAPEAATSGKLDPRVDVYSMGRLLAFLVLDKEPGDGDLKEIGEQVPGLVPIVRRATLAASVERYATAAELLSELDRCLRQFAPPEETKQATARRTGPGNSPAVEAAVAAAQRRLGSPESAEAPAAAAAPARRIKVPTPPVPVPVSPMAKSPAAAEPVTGNARMGALGVAGFIGAICAAFLLRSASDAVEDVLLGVAAISAAIAATSVPLRAALRLGLVVTAVSVVVVANPVGAVLGRGTLKSLRSDDAEERAAAARTLVAGGFKQLADARISGADLSGFDLSNADLEHADLTRVNLTGAKLASAKLDGAVLLMAQLQGADLTGASVSGVTAFEAASCDQGTQLPAGWHCNLVYGVVSQGDPR